MWNPFADRKISWTLVGVGALGVVAGVIFWGGFNTAMEATNSLGFCISCHEMRDTVYQEYKTSIHYMNPAGVRAVCSDCHVPKDWTHKVIRKVQASNELWHKLIGTIDTPEKFQAAASGARQRRLEDDEGHRQPRVPQLPFLRGDGLRAPEAAKRKRMQKAYQDGGQTCIDCHKGIAHKLPDMSTGYKALFDDLAGATPRR